MERDLKNKEQMNISDLVVPETDTSFAERWGEGIDPKTFGVPTIQRIYSVEHLSEAEFAMLSFLAKRYPKDSNAIVPVSVSDAEIANDKNLSRFTRKELNESFSKLLGEGAHMKEQYQVEDFEGEDNSTFAVLVRVDAQFKENEETGEQRLDFIAWMNGSLNSLFYGLAIDKDSRKVLVQNVRQLFWSQKDEQIAKQLTSNRKEAEKE